MAALMVGLGLLLVGQGEAARPYEMDRAGRVENPYPPLVDFENLDGWTVEVREAVASLAVSRERRLWGQSTGKVTYRADGRQPTVRLVPPAPLPCPDGFDTIALWTWGNNWGWINDATTPPVTISAVFATAAGDAVTAPVYRVNADYWFLSYVKLNPAQREALARGASLTAIELTGGHNVDDRSLWLDDLSLVREELAPLSYAPRPLRNLEPFAGQSVGANTGPGRLPFPTRPETILPSNLTSDYTTALRTDGEAFIFEYAGTDGRLVYRYEPRGGGFDGLTAQWAGRPAFRPCAGGGLVLATEAGPATPEQAEHLGSEQVGDTVVSRWRLTAGGMSVDATYTLRLWAKSLVVDVVAPGGAVAEVRYGRCAGLDGARSVQVPFYLYAPGRPMLVAATGDEPLFLMGNTCWYRSNASELFGSPGDEGGAVGYNGGARYRPKTDGARNDVYERLFVTVSPRVEEVLPNIANPPSPYRAVTGRGVWHAHGAGNRDTDAAYWRRAHRYGLRHLIITDHETMWRDAGESFTFRTEAAPGRGGDQSAEAYARLMQDELGYVYGPYNNYTDFAPVNAFWDPDRVIRRSDGQLETAWPRCYAPKPLFAVEACQALAPRIERKFGFSTAYCDVHTAIPPWGRTDYDARVPGAGTFAQTFYAWGEIMLLQRLAWGGPVYSEGTYHTFLHGLTDGNYGQEYNGQLWRRPWLVDFDLLKLHDLGCNFGMGNPGMFYGNIDWGSTRGDRDAVIDRFLAATIAFGHPGFLAFEGGFQNGLRSYHMVQQLAARYTQASIDETRYADADGTLHDTSHAVARGAFERSQVVNRYTDGTVTVVNGHPSERMQVAIDGRTHDLPPNGYAGRSGDGLVEVFSGEVSGHRIDLCTSPEYVFFDARGTFTRLPQAAGDGLAACRREGDGWELIPWDGSECGFDLGGNATAVALDEARNPLGPAEVRVARGLTWVTPVEGAVSYQLTPNDAPVVEVTAERDQVVPGERVTVRGATVAEAVIPPDARPGDHHFVAHDGGWVDFVVVPAAELSAALEGDTLRLTMVSHLATARDGTVTVNDRQEAVRLIPGLPVGTLVPLPPAEVESVVPLRVALAAGEAAVERDYVLRAVHGVRRLAGVRWDHRAGRRIRGGDESADFAGTGALCHDDRMACGGEQRAGLFMHPPYQTGPGYTYALLEPLRLPDEPVAFRCAVGKRDGSDAGDGILFIVAVVEPDGTETEAGRHVVTDHAWQPLEGDLTRWRGQTVRLKLIADVGEADNSTGDWACWADARLESPAEQLVRTLEQGDGPYATAPGPAMVAGLTLADLRAARSATLVFDGCGLEGSDAYPVRAALNGVACGRLPNASGREQEGVWSEGVRLPLPAEVIATLAARNQLELSNPALDFFKVRRFLLELELADGRRATSRVSTAAFTQPPSWPYLEGIGVAEGEPIRVELWFEVR